MSRDKLRPMVTKIRQFPAGSINWLWMNKLIVLAAIISAITSLIYAKGDGELSARWFAIAGGFIAAVVLLQTMRRANAAEKTIVQKTFSDAITHLGHESETVVLGGIYSLLDLARENRDYRHKVFDILCAHIRTTTTAEKYCEKYENKPSEIIETLLNLFFRDEKYDVFPAKKKEYIADLNGAHLAGSDLRKARLQGANLQKTQLQHADLQKAQLRGANLRKAQLRIAQLQNADLEEADLQEANLNGADLRCTKLQKANLRGASLRGESTPLDAHPGLVRIIEPAKLQHAQLDEANLQGAILSVAQLGKANLQEANLYQAELSGADLRGAQLQGADLRETFLRGSCLQEAHLQGADLTKAQLQGADLRETFLRGSCLQEAHLQGADLTKAQLQGADLRETFLRGSCLQEAHLQGADLTKAQLQGANLQEAELQGAKLQEAQMQGAHMHQKCLSHRTQLSGSDLRGVSSQATESPDEFAMNFMDRIKNRTGQEADLKGVLFPGTASDLTTFIENSAIIRGSYTEEEADQLIRKHEEVLRQALLSNW